MSMLRVRPKQVVVRIKTSNRLQIQRVSYRALERGGEYPYNPNLTRALNPGQSCSVECIGWLTRRRDRIDNAGGCAVIHRGRPRLRFDWRQLLGLRPVGAP